METLKFLLIAWSKRSSKASQKVRGFTLIELLVAMIMAALIITPLLGLVVNLMNTDRQEQAKTTSEQELQTAMEYISRDLQQAVYIYDAGALTNTTTNLADSTPGIQDQLPDVANGVPVLVFWKRKFMKDKIPVAGGGTNDAFVYSLVAYYLIKDEPPNPTSPWSGTARIGRFEIQDGVKDETNAYINETDPTIGRDDNFSQFIPDQPGTLATKMNRWKSENGTNTGYPNEKLPQNNILVDYIDQSTESVDGSAIPYEVCPADTDIADEEPEWTQVPDEATTDATFLTRSFYACVYSSRNIAKVYLRGNAMARLRQKSNSPTYDGKKPVFFPTAKIEVKGTGALGKN